MLRCRGRATRAFARRPKWRDIGCRRCGIATTERLLAAGHPKDPILVQHAQVHEINVCPIKENDLARSNPQERVMDRIKRPRLGDLTN
jgi:hypothetical protein